MFRVLLAATMLMGLASPARAEVLESASSGFTLRQAIRIEAKTPEQVWPLLVDQLGHWWDKSHTYSGDARKMRIEVVPGGCFCERYAAGSVVHATVINVQKNQMIRLSGTLGPLQETASVGTLTWTLAPDGKGTRLVLDYVVGGYRMGGLAEWAGPVDGVLAVQMDRLRRYAETGRADPPAP